ncbi:desulfoferrodoxin family protein [Hallella seregens]|uniref:Desulfoferrodoxin family protein n=1 Tax=Hallella seregens ATCC 51272 TaxID=1336250 RepID=A0ABV5ZLW4_9BACT|nr:desulfoferrodoxin family protein [Hallella seregens]
MKTNEIYKHAATGSLVEVLNADDGELAGEWKLMNENSTDAATEKHVPVLERVEGGYRVTVGSVEHPMTEAHSIQWIELVTETEVLRKYLTPNDKPVAEFKTDAPKAYAREYCNLHGLWKSEWL